MSLLIAIKTFLIFPVLFVKTFISHYSSVAPAYSASVAFTALHKCCSFGLRRPFQNCLAVRVEEVQILLKVLVVSVLPGDEVIL